MVWPWAMLLERRRARRTYFAADAEAARALEDFLDTNQSARQDALMVLAECEDRMADSMIGFRDDEDEDGFTLAQSHRNAAILLAMVADTEADPWPPTPRSDLSNDPAVLNTLVALSRTHEPRRKAELTMALYDVVVSSVGGQAAEALSGVAYSYNLLSGLHPQEARQLIWPHAPKRDQ